MSGPDRAPPRTRFRGPSARPPPLSEEARRALLQRLQSPGERGLPETTPAAPAAPAAPAERRAEQRRERGTVERGLSDVQRALRSAGPPPAPADAPAPSSTRPPSLARTPDPRGVDPQFGQRVDHVIAPDPDSAGRPAQRIPPPPVASPTARRVVQRTHDALDELNNRFFRDLWNRTAASLSARARSTHDAHLRRLRSRFERLVGRYPEGIPTRTIWEEARGIFDEAYERARSRWDASSFWRAVWRDEAATARLRELHERGVVRVEFDANGRPRGTPRVLQYDPRSQRYRWQPINIDHAVPLGRNPFGVLGGDNLVATTPLTNQRFLRDWSEHSPFPMRVDRFAGAHGDLDDAIENFALANGLTRHQRATPAQLDARFGPRPTRRPRVRANSAPDERRRRGARTSPGGQRVIRGFIPALSWALEMIVGTSRQALYREAVIRLRESDRRRRTGRHDRPLSDAAAHPPNLAATFERVVGDRHPVDVARLGELRQRLERHLDQWDALYGEAAVARQASAAATPMRRDDILNDYLTFSIDSMRALQDVLGNVQARLSEQDWAALSADAEQAAEAFDGLLESELREFAVTIEDADYLSRHSFHRIADAYRNFHDQLVLLRGLLFDAIRRYRRLIDRISWWTAH